MYLECLSSEVEWLSAGNNRSWIVNKRQIMLETLSMRSVCLLIRMRDRLEMRACYGGLGWKFGKMVVIQLFSLPGLLESEAGSS